MQPSSYSPPPQAGTVPPPAALYPPTMPPTIPPPTAPYAPYAPPGATMPPPTAYPPTMRPAGAGFPFPGLRLAGVVLVMAILAAIVSSLLPASAVAARKLAYPLPVVQIQSNPSSFSFQDVNNPIQFTADVIAGRDLTFAWAYTTGSSGTAMGNGQSISYTFNQAADYTVTLDATDALGQVAEQASLEVNLLPPPPQASFTANEDPSNLDCYQFDGRGSSGYQLTYSWDFGDGSSDSSATPYHCYPSYYGYYAYYYTVRLTVTDAAGQQSTTTQEVYDPGY